MSVQSLQRDSTLYYVNRVAAERTKQLIEGVKTWCIAHEVKQRVLADKLGVSRQLVTEWFAFRKKPTSEHTLTLLGLLKSTAKPNPKAKKLKS